MSKNKISASESTVEEIPNSANTKGSQFRYTGEGYMPVGAMKVRALSRLKAIQAFRESLEEFGYSDDSDAGYDDYDDSNDDHCDCGACRIGRE